jgi:tRNA A37 methylthiotransferase MiaB
MKRFGGRGPFLDLLNRVRELAPDAGARSNFIVGFPGEAEDDLAELESFLSEARLDAVGVFGYSDEEGTDAVDFADKVPPEVIAERVERITALADEVSAQRAEDRIGTRVDVLVEDVDDDPDCDPEWAIVGRAAHQGPDTDGVVRLVGAAGEGTQLRRGTIVEAFVRESFGVDLLAEPVGRPW